MYIYLLLQLAWCVARLHWPPLSAQLWMKLVVPIKLSSMVWFVDCRVDWQLEILDTSDPSPESSGGCSSIDPWTLTLHHFNMLVLHALRPHLPYRKSISLGSTWSGFINSVTWNWTDSQALHNISLHFMCFSLTVFLWAPLSVPRVDTQVSIL